MEVKEIEKYLYRNVKLKLKKDAIPLYLDNQFNVELSEFTIGKITALELSDEFDNQYEVIINGIYIIYNIDIESIEILDN